MIELDLDRRNLSGFRGLLDEALLLANPDAEHLGQLDGGDETVFLAQLGDFTVELIELGGNSGLAKEFMAGRLFALHLLAALIEPQVTQFPDSDVSGLQLFRHAALDSIADVAEVWLGVGTMSRTNGFANAFDNTGAEFNRDNDGHVLR